MISIFTLMEIFRLPSQSHSASLNRYEISCSLITVITMHEMNQFTLNERTTGNTVGIIIMFLVCSVLSVVMLTLNTNRNV